MTCCLCMPLRSAPRNRYCAPPRIQYISPMRYGFLALIVNEFSGLQVGSWGGQQRGGGVPGGRTGPGAQENAAGLKAQAARIALTVGPVARQ